MFTINATNTRTGSQHKYTSLLWLIMIIRTASAIKKSQCCYNMQIENHLQALPLAHDVKLTQNSNQESEYFSFQKFIINIGHSNGSGWLIMSITKKTCTDSTSTTYTVQEYSSTMQSLGVEGYWIVWAIVQHTIIIRKKIWNKHFFVRWFLPLSHVSDVHILILITGL